jgi:hypothetical protein
MTEECFKKRSWPGAAIQARVFRATNGTIPAVIVVECRSGLAIRPTARSLCFAQHSAQVPLLEENSANLDAGGNTYNPLVVELELAAAVASALWEG